MEVKINPNFLSQVKAIAGRMGRHGHKIRVAAKDAVQAATEDLYEDAVKMMPRETGLLEDEGLGIEIESAGIDTTGYVYLNEEGGAGEYVNYMHNGDYELGKVSVLKQSMQPERVGPLFLDRAFSEGMAKRREMIFKILAKAMDSRG